MSDANDVAGYLSEAECLIGRAESFLHDLEQMSSTEVRRLHAARTLAAMRHLKRLMAMHRAAPAISIIVEPVAAKASWKRPRWWPGPKGESSPASACVEPFDDQEIPTLDDAFADADRHGHALPG